MTLIDDRIQTYLAACAVEGKSPNTVASYRASLADFHRTGAKLGLPDELAGYTVPHVYTFLHDVRSRGASPAYQHRRHREVKAFFSWCKRMGMVEENVFARVALVKLEQQIVQPYNADDVQRLLASQDRNSHSGCRNHALFLFLLDTSSAPASASGSTWMTSTGNGGECACSMGRAGSNGGSASGSGRSLLSAITSSGSAATATVRSS